MHRPIHLAALVLAACSAIACQSASDSPWYADRSLAVESVDGVEASNSTGVGGRVYFAGQPSQADIDRYAAMGVKTVINLRRPNEMESVGFDERAAVEAAGMTYVHVPYNQSAPIGDDDYNKVAAALDAAGDAPALMHCGSSNRVGYVWALYQRDRVGLDLNEAISEGEKAGLRSDGLKGFIRTTPPPPRP